MREGCIVGVETGGEHMVVAVASASSTDTTILERWECPTTKNSSETLAEVRKLIETAADKYGPLRAVGIASFGPIDPEPTSPTYGYITTTPKPGWGNTDVLTGLGRGSSRFADVKWGFDTDVNAAALAELRAQKKKALENGEKRIPESCVYITVGTGVGVGVLCCGGLVHGMLHPEGGHMIVPRSEGDTFVGSCPFHKCCVEGMVASGALSSRLGIDRSQLRSVPDSDPVWNHIAHYLAHCCATLALVVSPEVIVFGGGIMNRSCLFPLIRQKIRQILSGYINVPQLSEEGIEKYIVPASFGADTGVQGALELARRALH